MTKVRIFFDNGDIMDDETNLDRNGTVDALCTMPAQSLFFALKGGIYMFDKISAVRFIEEK